MSSSQRVPAQNRLLAALPRSDRARILANCEQVTLTLGQRLCEAGAPLRHVHFPIECFISLLTPVDKSDCLEVGLVGNEGMFGIPLLLGVNDSVVQGLVQGAGTAWRLKAAQFHRELDRSPPLQKALQRYLYVLVAQLAQTAACNRFHLVEARLARWLLMTRDRAGSNQFYVTHEFLAYMLGVRRVGVTKAAGALQAQKLISYRRGNLTILNRRRLESAACTCYRAGKNVYERILG
jgi:CRP-like cAMP-binding protein